MIEIPVVSFKQQSADFEQILDFENVTVTIRLTYNTRVNYWFVTFSTNDSLISSLKFSLIDCL